MAEKKALFEQIKQAILDENEELVKDLVNKDWLVEVEAIAIT